MKRKASSILLTAAFLLAVFCPHILWRAGFGQSAVENAEKRTLSQKPVFSLEEIDRYPREYEEYYNDYLPFRDWLIRLYSGLQYHVFHTSSNNDVIMGKDGWLFYSSRTDGTSLQCYDGSLLFTQEELEQIARNLSDAKERLAAQGAEFIVFIAPSKERVYSEYMPDHLGQPAQECMVNQVISYLNSHTDVKVIYPYEEMIAYKNAYPEHLLYYQTDTHWNGLGGYIGTRALLSEVGIEIPPLEQMDIVPGNRFPCDLPMLLNLKGLSEAGFVTVSQTNSGQEVKVLSDEEYGRMEFEMEGAPPISLMMHKDSFGTVMAPYLRNNLSHVLLVHNYEYDAQQVWETRPDVFVLEVTERYIRRLRNPVL